MFALNCLLQIEQVNSENDASDDDSLALALRFLSASPILLDSLSYPPFLMRQLHFARFSAICSGLLWYVEFL